MSPAVGGYVYDTDLDDLDRVVFVEGVGATADSSAIGSTETVVLTVPSTTYKANTAYRIEFAGTVSVSVADNSPNIKFRKTNNAGQQFCSTFTTCHTITVGYGARTEAYFQVGAADVTAVIVMTLTGSGSYNAKMVASSTSPGTLNVFKVGPAANYTFAPTLV